MVSKFFFIDLGLFAMQLAKEGEEPLPVVGSHDTAAEYKF